MLPQEVMRVKSIADRMETAVYYGMNLRICLSQLPDETLAALESALDYVEGELDRISTKKGEN